MSRDTYFSEAAASRADGATGTYSSVADQPEIEAAPGVRLRAVAAGTLMLSYVSIDPHSEAPTHTHDEEQTGIVLSGVCEFELDGEIRTMRTGDTYHAPPGVPHGVRTGDVPCDILDVFSPPRQALVALIEEARR
jgi:quercetin dioxygenase-like cupin family protein